MFTLTARSRHSTGETQLAIQTVNYTVETSRQYFAPLGQALWLMIKLIENVTEAPPLLKVGWTLLSSVYTAVQQHRVDNHDVRGLAENS
ncbi:hypothetical protein BDN67DRAFT_970452 [Paxillus ammoniavirescens]|nr:hypothetical protein BDN67DRAFT_970452 [Paxillus ammoniavirescens]